ncbi:MAG: thiamine ABC transporter substrate binding subunit [bacterium]
MSQYPIRGLAVAVVAAALAACAGAPATSPETSSSSGASPTVVRLATHDSFALSEDVVDALADQGIDLEVVTGGDAVEVVNRAVLSAGNPDADVLYGVDTTTLDRALAAGVFDPYVATADGALRPELVTLGKDTVTPIDDGDVCVNIDDAWFADQGIAPPKTLEDLADPRYRGLLVAQNPATSSPGLSFLLSTIAHFGDGWRDYWRMLRENDVKVVNGWSEAYLAEFTGGGGDGDRPLVVSYSTSPPAEIVYAADPKPERPATSAMREGCYHQVEFAGVLRGTPVPEAARRVVDWLASEQVQADIPLNMFVFPARSGVALPEVFAEFAPRPERPLELDSARVADEQSAWVDEWTEIVLR